MASNHSQKVEAIADHADADNDSSHVNAKSIVLSNEAKVEQANAHSLINPKKKSPSQSARMILPKQHIRLLIKKLPLLKLPKNKQLLNRLQQNKRLLNRRLLKKHNRKHNKQLKMLRQHLLLQPLLLHQALLQQLRQKQPPTKVLSS